MTTVRSGASVNSYLILKQNDKVLLQLRKNTGYKDGWWCLPAGHVEDGEGATEAMAREAQEELGIALSGLKVVHVMHRQSNRFNIDIFFTCESWEGSIQNNESHKCEKLEFFPLDALPENIVDYNLAVLKDSSFYSELGWI